MSSNNAEIFYLPSGCNCDGTNYSQSAIETAAQEALSLASESRTLGRDKYPHAYNDYEHFTFSHAKAPYLEFPVEQNGSAYNGGSPGADRVILGSIAEDFSSAVYCAVVTHDGQKKNGFAECGDDTMNVRGKGSYEPDMGDDGEGGESKGRKHEHRHRHGGRKLVQRIDMKQ